MANLRKKEDLTFRMGRTGSMVVGKRGEYVCNIVQMLFSMVPGTDEFDINRGLDIRSRNHKPYTEGTRDTEYENEILQQFTTYTDLMPLNIVAMYLRGTFLVYMEISYENQVYSLDINADTLTAVLRDDSYGKALSPDPSIQF